MILVVTGTGTDVGKTVVTAAIAALARSQGQRVAVVKPIQTGVLPREDADLSDITRLSGVTDVHEFIRYPDPLSPHAAARRVGAACPSLADLAAATMAVAQDRDLVLVEGAGGILVHLNECGGTLADLAGVMQAPVLVVARPDLGTLNHTALTLEALDRRGLELAGVVVGSWPVNPDLACQENLHDLRELAGGQLLGRMPAESGRLSAPEFLSAAQSGIGAPWGDFSDD